VRYQTALRPDRIGLEWLLARYGVIQDDVDQVYRTRAISSGSAIVLRLGGSASTERKSCRSHAA
jgi:hypothetical protein